MERLTKEVKRRGDVVGIFPTDAAVLRLVGAIVSEQHAAWPAGRRYVSAASLAQLTPPPAAPAPPLLAGSGAAG